MDKVLEFIIICIKNKDFSIILSVLLIILAMISPSWILIFFYKRNIFYKLEFTKLITLCASLNILFFAAIFLIEFSSEIQRCTKEINGRSEKLEEKELKNLREDTIYKSLIITVIKLLAVPVLVMFYYIMNVISFSSKISFKSIVIAIIIVYALLLGIKIIKIINEAIQEARYVIKSKIKKNKKFKK
ncbi:hypothetical protein AL713_15965 [Clostridium botulinum]|uniref:hypothetical protein n=1 Tax=Clostridium botulinum TaxID=1491 RepID=UPI00099B811F|nr:hypothetical protein [Clostridium botulinum]OPD29597.1 hypothetical protein AL713_15965 [Clostridium botulinum]HCL4559284.1 hypothetical protein [Clostridium botulinum]HCL4570056.1 hypothetical protein [Clostridium botulinum]HCL4584872.1 hypothetical protein [Clostridium botulinum]